VSGTPTVRLDGDFEVVGGMQTGNNYMAYRSYFDNRKEVPSALEIDLACTYDSAGRSGHLDIKLKNTTANPVDGMLQVALCENHIYQVWGNLDSLQHVERAMLPSAAGESVSVAANDSLSKSRDFTVDAAWVARNCELVVFVQNTGRKTIVQGAHVGLYQIPQLEYRGYANAYPEPGGDANLTVALRNIGSGDAATVSGTLSTSDAYVDVTTANADFGSIAIAQDVYSLTPFAIHVDAACPDNHLATMNLAVSGANGYSTSVNFPLNITAGRGFSDDMETGTNGWSHSGVVDNWHQTIHRSQSPATSWYCGVENSWQYANQADAMLVTPYFTAGDPAQVTFDQWYSVSPGDNCVVEVNNGSRFWPLLEYYNGANGDWENRLYSLQDWSGQTIRLGFRLLTNYSTVSEGWYVDNFLCQPYVPGVAEHGAGAQVLSARLAARSPAFRTAAIAYTVPAGHSAQLAAFDANGRLVTVIASRLTGAGRADWNLARVDAGAYFVRLSDETSSKVTKVVVAK